MKHLSGWYRLYIILAIMWTIWVIILATIVVVHGESPFWYFCLLWLVPVGLVYGTGRAVGWIIKGFRKGN
ncbi:MAG: hypothetical protein ACYSTS_16650 [Planctomycetota bacterium]|jgi:hypothetical protein